MPAIQFRSELFDFQKIVFRVKPTLVIECGVVRGMYAGLVSNGSYLLVLKTVIENIPKDNTREWGPRTNSQTAVLEYMLERKDFENDANIEQRIGITVAPKGFWIRVQ